MPLNRMYTVDSMEWFCYELFLDVIENMSDVKCGSRSIRSSLKCRYKKSLLRKINELSEKHQILFKGMMDKLRLNNDSAGSSFTRVVNEIFTDEIYNWGRIVSVYALGGWMARDYVSMGMSHHVQDFAEISGRYIVATLGPHIEQAGGWVS